ncbi:MAG: hypothetical protein WCM76_13370 [Bacteroidota bacterium]
MKTKTAFFSAILLLSAFFAEAQNYTLHFSQVKLIGSTLATVPSGSVWKVESVMSTDVLVPSSGISDNSYYTIFKSIEVNGSAVVINRASRWAENYSRYNSEAATDIGIGQVTELPLWLPAGTTLKTGTNALYISVIEFNLVTP